MAATSARARQYSSQYLSIFKKSPYIRLWLLRNPWLRPLSVFNYAAVTIQRHLRGFYSRRRRTDRQGIRTLRRKSRQSGNCRQLEKYLQFSSTSKKPDWLAGGYSAWCAVRIQSLFRMHQVCKKIEQKKLLVNQVAAIVIQTFWRNLHLHRKWAKQANPETRTMCIRYLPKQLAAQKIQMFWRSHCNRRIFRYFRDLILIHLKSAPVGLLKIVLRNEFEFLDRAAGVHVKFRLAGYSFPPKVVFKIFTHRPLCDVNAFAPRDYTRERKMDALVFNNRSRGYMANPEGPKAVIRVGVRYFDAIVETTNSQGTKNWYKRSDANDWRPIVMSNIPRSIGDSQDLSYLKNKREGSKFHFNRLFRKKELKMHKLNKQQKWFQRSSASAIQTAELNDGALIDWSVALDFEAYWEQWNLIGTSLPSDAADNCMYYRET